MRIFVAGASGVIGSRLVPLLVKDGHEVTGMTRSPEKTESLERLGAQPVVCDAYDGVRLTEAVVSVDTTEYYLYNQLAGTGGEPQEAVLNRLAGGAIVNALADVPPAFREVVVLVDIGDFSYQEAADILGVPIGTVMSRLHRGRRALKQALAQRAGAEAP